jgi:hypothetical protein
VAAVGKIGKYQVLDLSHVNKLLKYNKKQINSSHPAVEAQSKPFLRCCLINRPSMSVLLRKNGQIWLHFNFHEAQYYGLFKPLLALHTHIIHQNLPKLFIFPAV